MTQACSTTGMFSEGSSFQKGDPKLEELIEKARGEFDNAKQRRAGPADVQRLEAKAQYRPSSPRSRYDLPPRLASNRQRLSLSWHQAETWRTSTSGIDKAKAPLG